MQAIGLAKTGLPLPSSQARVAVWCGLIVSIYSRKASAATRALHACARAASPIHGYEWPQRRNGIRRSTNAAPYRLIYDLGKSKLIAKADGINVHHIVMSRSQKPISPIKVSFF